MLYMGRWLGIFGVGSFEFCVKLFLFGFGILVDNNFFWLSVFEKGVFVEICFIYEYNLVILEFCSWILFIFWFVRFCGVDFLFDWSVRCWVLLIMDWWGFKLLWFCEYDVDVDIFLFIWGKYFGVDMMFCWYCDEGVEYIWIGWYEVNVDEGCVVLFISNVVFWFIFIVNELRFFFGWSMFFCVSLSLTGIFCNEFIKFLDIEYFWFVRIRGWVIVWFVDIVLGFKMFVVLLDGIGNFKFFDWNEFWWSIVLVDGIL